MYAEGEGRVGALPSDNHGGGGTKVENGREVSLWLMSLCVKIWEEFLAGGRVVIVDASSCGS